jgi:hypothetical protein
MSRFDERWKALTRAARGAPEPPLVPLRSEWLEGLEAKRRERAAPAPRTWSGWAPEWALPAAAVLLLYALALPAVGEAWASARSLTHPLAAVPRAPSFPSPPVPTPPPLPRPPVAGGSEILQNLIKEMQP